jgi:hypothetical protein
VNAAFKHLEDRLRIGELTIAQWGWLTVGVTLALVWGFYLSPFGQLLTIFTAIYVAALPALAALFAGFTEFDLLGFARGAVRWWRDDGRYLPGEAPDVAGYVVRDDSDAGRSRGLGETLPPDLAELWER